MKMGLLAVAILCAWPLAAQSTPRLGVNISRGFAYTCPVREMNSRSLNQV